MQFIGVNVWKDPELMFYFVPPKLSIALFVWDKKIYDRIHWSPEKLKNANGERIYSERFTCDDFKQVYKHALGRFKNDENQLRVLDVNLFSDEYVFITHHNTCNIHL